MSFPGSGMQPSQIQRSARRGEYDSGTAFSPSSFLYDSFPQNPFHRSTQAAAETLSDSTLPSAIGI